MRAAVTLGEVFLQRLAHGRGPCVEFVDVRGEAMAHDWAGAGARIAQIAAELLRRGAAADSRVLLQLARGDDFYCAFWACQVVGAAAMPAPAADRSARGRGKAQTRAGEPHFIITDCADHALANDDRCIVPGDWPQPGQAGQLFKLRRETDPDAPALIQFTSGSTSEPRGCVLSHRAVLANTRSICARLGVRDGDTSIHWVPLHHDMGLMGGLLAPVVGGARTMIFDTKRFMLQPLSWLRALAGVNGTHTSVSNFAIAMVLKRMSRLELASEALAGVRSLICGAEPLDPALMRRFLAEAARFGLPPEALHPAYGLAELTVMATSRRGLRTRSAPSAGSDPAPRELACVGAPLPGVEIRILDRDGADSAEGEVAIRTPSAMDGYFRDDAATWKKLQDGWLMTGDLGFLDKGELFITGRISDMIIVAGQNIYPLDIERSVASALGLDEHRICAFSAPGADTERVVVAVESRGRSVADVSLQAARSRCLETCGVAPAAWVVSNEALIPRTSSGKPRRLHLRSRFLDGSLRSLTGDVADVV